MPIGSELARKIEEQLNNEFSMRGSQNGPIRSALMRSASGLTSKHVQAANQIRRGIFAQPSIDDLLNEWREESEMIQVGKVAIASTILAAERMSSLAQTATSDMELAHVTVSNLRDCWLAFLLKNLRRNLNRRNVAAVFQDVAFIVFNYDRCIEQYLYWAFQSVGGLTADSAEEAVRNPDRTCVWRSRPASLFKRLSLQHRIRVRGCDS
jgi:hypothetical protein